MLVNTIVAKVLSLDKLSWSVSLVKEDIYTNMGRKEFIIQEAMKLFSLNGYLNTGIKDIIESSNSSKGGFYHYFDTKEDLFYVVLAEAQRIWREKTLDGLNQIDNPVDKIVQLLMNYKDNYLKDSEMFPGGCIFVTLFVELDNQRPPLAKEVEKGFISLKKKLRRFLDEGKEFGYLKKEVDAAAVSEMLFSSMLGASINCGAETLPENLDASINSLINYVHSLRSDTIKRN
jgi:AcrR family transcriptional regulator